MRDLLRRALEGASTVSWFFPSKKAAIIVSSLAVFITVFLVFELGILKFSESKETYSEKVVSEKFDELPMALSGIFKLNNLTACISPPGVDPVLFSSYQLTGLSSGLNVKNVVKPRTYSEDINITLIRREEVLFINSLDRRLFYVDSNTFSCSDISEFLVKPYKDNRFKYRIVRSDS